MWKKIKQSIWEEKEQTPKQTPRQAEELIIQLALDHYCAICNRGFAKVSAAKAHFRAKHKPVDNSVDN